MKFFIACAVFLLGLAFIPAKKEKVFKQDVAAIHDASNSLPEGIIARIQLVYGVPVAQTQGMHVEYIGSSWVKSKISIPEKNMPVLNYQRDPEKYKMLSPIKENYGWVVKSVCTSILQATFGSRFCLPTVTTAGHPRKRLP